MTAEISEVTQAALALSPEDRTELAHTLLVSLENDEAVDQAAVNEAWAAEIRRRFDEIRNGSVEMLSWAEVETRIDAQLAAKQQ